MTDASVSTPGLGIQCEQCHGTGQAATTGQHANTGVVVSSGIDVLGQSQVCGQCHGSYTNVAGTMGIYGYTTNLAMRDFVDINGASGGQSYTKIPTEEEFAASPAAYWMFPNGSNAKGNHYYYNEWAASGHSFRSALTATDPDAMAFQAAGNGHYSNNFDPNLTTGCYKCHTGEGYLQSKGSELAEDLVLTKDNVGKMGQECATCHNGHPSGRRRRRRARSGQGRGAQRQGPERGQRQHLRGLPQLAGRGHSARCRTRLPWPTSPPTAARATRSARPSTVAARCSTRRRAPSSCPAPSAKTATCPRPTRPPPASRTA